MHMSLTEFTSLFPDRPPTPNTQSCSAASKACRKQQASGAGTAWSRVPAGPDHHQGVCSLSRWTGHKGNTSGPDSPMVPWMPVKSLLKNEQVLYISRFYSKQHSTCLFLFYKSCLIISNNGFLVRVVVDLQYILQTVGVRWAYTLNRMPVHHRKSCPRTYLHIYLHLEEIFT